MINNRKDFNTIDKIRYKNNQNVGRYCQKPHLGYKQPSFQVPGVLFLI